jgi:6-phosphogluconolactonase
VSGVAETGFCVLDDAEAIARYAADWLVAKLEHADHRPLALCLSGGTTPRLLYRRLAQSPYREAVPWQHTHCFWSDERFVAPTHERSNYDMTRRLLLDRVPIPPENVHRIQTESGSPGEAAAAYEQELKQFYRAPVPSPDRPLFDVTFLGIGADGHIASLFPGSAVLHERSRWTAASTDPEHEPRITLTFPVLESSRDVVFLVSGEAKRDILRRARDGAPDLPAAQVRPVGRVHWFVDRAAAGS